MKYSQLVLLVFEPLGMLILIYLCMFLLNIPRYISEILNLFFCCYYNILDNPIESLSIWSVHFYAVHMESERTFWFFRGEGRTKQNSREQKKNMVINILSEFSSFLAIKITQAVLSKLYKIGDSIFFYAKGCSPIFFLAEERIHNSY